MEAWNWASDPPTYDTVWEDGEIAKDENGKNKKVFVPWQTVKERYREHVNTSVAYGKIPNKSPRMATSIRNYADYGIMPGHFLTALFTNDLRGTFRHADGTNRELIPEWLTWTWWDAPGCFSFNSVDGMVEHCRKMID